MLTLLSVLILDVWGFDESAINLLHDIEPTKDAGLLEKYSVLLDADSDLLKKHGSLQTVGLQLAQ